MRALGLPARYVSGYLHPEREAGVGPTVTGESHAWVEWWDGGWCSVDQTKSVEVAHPHRPQAQGGHLARTERAAWSGLATSSRATCDDARRRGARPGPCAEHRVRLPGPLRDTGGDERTPQPGQPRAGAEGARHDRAARRRLARDRRR
ncbi:transglutaminase domain-containing protein [Geodermatophilus sabuli]|uniref:transglutaminase domain-containing protein n=1 Tax=Geodermatophilus sabuli TaxID=1564158 RepID=UPI0021A6471B|nr:transglutaminase domain-containing protein [Geodermatophilus sabuli]